jgi:YfiH family protein
MNKNNHWLRPDWPAPANVHAATTLRTGGVSQIPFGSLNPAAHVGDEAECVRHNRHTINTLLALPAEPKWLTQTHSDRAVDAALITTEEPADASFTDKAGVVCAVMTADCLPLLVCSDDGRHIAAIHAGWRGLLAGIINNTIAALRTNAIMVWLGPAIGPAHFEVGEEVRAAFVDKSARFAPAFAAPHNGKWQADIYHLARIELAALGITRVYGGHFCTFGEPERFFSYRRDLQTGRMATLIWRTDAP